ncbi:UDP-N-acetylmuramoyl-L-alanyl-D-glutamate--2,6-diaminopimelate ligase [Pararobbsia silviterrae]|uniref:UDP-N-acetylmuramoyl-L-alanyl-D-glutamate--2,6-diaminopimelate ligase n=1 Tax=Pararobbsia silviterrae TaxID=1792498 RepID=A0A494XDC3_9BURK|nr:UDP-N-acetylmuramoyl-L-alanyl-D-glutamate--2,6-diaminopimelate ligase [Pararobbsia silviterrae]RKP48508.1 UDP-N-acetylmuramoyl-L-alanyl-D-glutamate--2,6-diaminopimelate ligase [Pararobbsia silviterrae]
MSARTPHDIRYDASRDAEAVAHAVAWLRTHVASSANLHADSRSLAAGDVFVAYAVDGADNRAHAAAASHHGAVCTLWHTAGGLKPPASIEHVLPVDHLDRLAGPIASVWYGEPSEAMQVIGITGTNGKTSCSHWIAHALSATGVPCGVVGTLGVGLAGHLVETGFTTPDAPQLQRVVARLRGDGAKAVAMEVSSHALHQGRVNGVAFDVAVFTNLTQDHLDYHGTLDAYEAAKARLFDWPGLKAAVINRDDPAGVRLLASLPAGVRAIAYGIGSWDAHDVVRATGAGDAAFASLVATDIRATARGTAFHLESDWGAADLEVATLGAFNVDNLLAVLGALLASDVPFDAALAQIAKVESVPGRMQRIGGKTAADEPLVVIDYAHTPDALDKTLDALRPVAQVRGGRLVCVFGCGGDRDAGKRPKMGAIAERRADQIVITSDNPRSEAPAAIIDQIAAGMSDPARARKIEDRASAILQAIRAAAREDVVVIAGKGHEATQEIMGRKRAFSDLDHARLALSARATKPHAEGA